MTKEINYSIINELKKKYDNYFFVFSLCSIKNQEIHDKDLSGLEKIKERYNNLIFNAERDKLDLGGLPAKL